VDKDVETRLFCGVHDGDEGVLKVLLEREDINPKTINKNCTKPQSIVACNRQEGVVQMLLG